MTQYIPAGVGEELPEHWDVAYLNDERCPGIAKVSAPKRKWKWDDKKSKGTSGDPRTFNGIDPVKFSIEILLTTEEEHEDFKTRILPILDKPVGDKQKPESIAIRHAATEARKVDAFSVDELTGPAKNDQNQVTYTVDATEYRAPKPAATGGISGAKYKGQAADCAGCKTREQQIRLEMVDADAEYLAVLNSPPSVTPNSDIALGPEDQFRFDEWQARLNQALARKTGAVQAYAANADQARAFHCDEAPPTNSSMQGP